MLCTASWAASIEPVQTESAPGAAALVQCFRNIETQLFEINAKLDGLGATPVRWLTMNEAAAALGLRRSGLDYHVHAGNMVPVERDGLLYVTEQQVQQVARRPRLRKARIAQGDR